MSFVISWTISKRTFFCVMPFFVLGPCVKARRIATLCGRNRNRQSVFDRRMWSHTIAYLSTNVILQPCIPLLNFGPFGLLLLFVTVSATMLLRRFILSLYVRSIRRCRRSHHYGAQRYTTSCVAFGRFSSSQTLSTCPLT